MVVWIKIVIYYCKFKYIFCVLKVGFYWLGLMVLIYLLVNKVYKYWWCNMFNILIKYLNVIKSLKYCSFFVFLM